MLDLSGVDEETRRTVAVKDRKDLSGACEVPRRHDALAAGVSARQRGQALAEAGIVIVLFMAIALGLITFGHAFMALNMITHAARDGARVAATWPYRGSCGGLIQTSAIQTQVRNEIASTVGGSFQVNVTQNPTPPGGSPCGTPPQTPTVQVTVVGCVPWVFPILPRNFGTNCNGQTGFAVSRVAVFHDEGV